MARLVTADSASVTPGGAAKSMSATHIGIPSAAVIPESLAMLSHFDACVPRRSITRSKPNIGTVAPVLAALRRQMRRDSNHVSRGGLGGGMCLCQQHRVRAVDRIGAVDHGLFQRACLHRNVF